VNSSRLPQNLNVTRELGSEAIGFDLEIVRTLKVDPEARGIAKEPSEPEGSVRSDRSLAVDDFVDPASGDAESLRQAVFSEGEGLEKILCQDLAGVDRSKFLTRHQDSLLDPLSRNLVEG
jgi:hypothetical protein